MFIQWQGYTLNVSKILFIVKHKDVYINGTTKFCVKIVMEDNNTIFVEGTESEVDQEVTKLSELLNSEKI